MRSRLYFLLLDLSIARQIMDDLLLARIEARRIHVLARRGTDLEDIPEASVLQKTDVVHGAQVGAVLGAFAGVLGGILLVAFPPNGLSVQLVTVLVAALLGALFGVWAASLAGASVPNSKLKQFQPWIEQGRLLLMVDVPLHTTVRTNHRARHQAASRGRPRRNRTDHSRLPLIGSFPRGSVSCHLKRRSHGAIVRLTWRAVPAPLLRGRFFGTPACYS